MDVVLYDWPFFGLAAGLVGLVLMIAWPRAPGRPSRWRDPEWLVCLMLPVYMIHQFEEHGINLLGQRYHFLSDMCGVLGHPRLVDCPADPAFIFAVNVGGGVWLPGLLAIVWRRRNVMVGACAMGIPLVNLVAHVGQAVARARYNSGLLTAFLLFVPMCGWTLTQFYRAGILDRTRLIAVVVTGGIVHGLLIASVLARGHGLLGETSLLIINVAYGFIPLAIGTLLPPPVAWSSGQLTPSDR